MKPHWRVLIIDDHAASRAAVAEAVTAQGGQVVGNGSRAEDVLRLVDKYPPDLAVLAGRRADGGRGAGPPQRPTAVPWPAGMATRHPHPPHAAAARERG